MSTHKEAIEFLNSGRKDQIEVLNSLKAQGAEAIKELEAARAANDEGAVSTASEKIDRIGEDIKSAQSKVEEAEEQIGWFKEYADDVEFKSADRKEEMRELFESMKSHLETGAPETKKFTVGEHFANLLKYRGIDRAEHVANRPTELVAYLSKDANFTATGENKEALKSIKSIYSNHGAVLLDGASAPVPGYMGAQCGLVEDPNIYCLLEPARDDFEECISQATLNGNRIRFTREASRDDNAASVLETVYNPYPTFERDGTKPEGTFTLETITVNDSKIAEFVVASDEVLEDCASVAGLIDRFLIDGINREKRRQLIDGSGLNGEMLGILNQPGLLTRTHQDVGDGGTADDNFYDTLRRGLTDLWLQSASTENVCVIMNPRDGEIVDLTKDEMGRYLFNDSDCFSRQLRCLRMRYSVDVPQGTAILGDFANNWVFYTRKALSIRMGYTGDQFITNTNTILGEMRGLTLVRCPRKILTVTGLA